MQGKTKTTFINQSELEQRLNNQIKPTSFRLISGLEYTVYREYNNPL
jgi:hypothetical protein